MLTVRIASVAFFTVLCLPAQNPDLRFEVASIKPSAPGSRPGSIRPAPGRRRYVGSSVSLKLIMTVAYHVSYDQISGPGWISDELYDVNAEAEKPSGIEDLHMMLRNMVIDRFRLRLHSETKIRPVYVLSVDKAGVRMTPRDKSTADDPAIAGPGPGSLTGHFVPMDYFAWLMSLFLDRPIVDRTGLKGVYDFQLSWNPALSADIPADNAAPGIFEAVRKELGLRLEAENGPLPILVIDHVERPMPD